MVETTNRQEAKGMELEFAKVRHGDPDKYFEMAGQLGAQIAERYEAGDDA